MDTPINKLPKPVIKQKKQGNLDGKPFAKPAAKKRVKKVKHIDQLYDEKFLANYQK